MGASVLFFRTEQLLEFARSSLDPKRNRWLVAFLELI